MANGEEIQGTPARFLVLRRLFLPPNMGLIPKKEDDHMGIRAVGYCRANDTPSAKQELRQQQERIHAYCCDNHLTLEHIYMDAGVSGFICAGKNYRLC